MTPSRKIAVVVNPRSAGGKTGRRWRDVQGRLERRLGPVTARFTDSPGAGIGLTRELLHEGFDLIVAAGGDGTTHEVANGFLEDDRAVNPEACLGILPMGTGGDFRRAVGMSARLDSAIEILAAGVPQTIDLGRATFESLSGGRMSRYFINLLSFGMGGDVAARSPNLLTGLSGRAAFLWATAQAFLNYQGSHVRLRLDGGPEQSYFVINLAVGNGGYHGGGMHPCPLARLDDGLLEVTVIEHLSGFELLRDGRFLYSSNIYRHPKTHHSRARRLTAETDDEAKIEIDGEPLGRLPLEVVVLPRRLKVITPPKA